jgi:hypothetical protein
MRAARREHVRTPSPDIPGMALKRSLRGRRSRILVVTRDSQLRFHSLLSLGGHLAQLWGNDSPIPVSIFVPADRVNRRGYLSH